MILIAILASVTVSLEPASSSSARRKQPWILSIPSFSQVVSQSYSNTTQALYLRPRQAGLRKPSHRQLISLYLSTQSMVTLQISCR
ncbi:hypothetical protein BJ170DRAFT_248940 [Xylariales sp. AK1849]|nr:hypothetical protein BJ170DRAFT_248940 [Xylariales sp. AK1849]